MKQLRSPITAVAAGCVVLGTGIGVAMENVAAGALIGTGAGILLAGMMSLPERLMRLERQQD